MSGGHSGQADKGIIAHCGQSFQSHVAGSLDSPFIVLLKQDGADETQVRRYADQLGVPFIFLSKGEEVWFSDKGQDAHFRRVETVFAQDDLVHRSL